MDTSCNTDNAEKHGNENEFNTLDSVFTCATTQMDTMPMNAPHNTNMLYDALSVSDTVSNLEVATANVASTEVTQNQNSTEGDKSALSQLLEYGMSDSEDSQSDSEESLSDSRSDIEENSSLPNVEETVPNSTNFREIVSSSDSSSEYESDSSSSISDIGACGGTPAPEKIRLPETMGPPRTRGELTLEELPPIEELKISVAEEECIEVGVVTSIIDQLVIVQSLRGSAAYDIDTLFFLNRGKSPLGRVFDVLGPVTEPLYAIRFNSYEQAIETGVKTGTPVYCAPRTQHTQYVFVSELMKMKGSDASWEHNNEPPEVFLDYSDDEEERKARRVRKKPNPEATKSSSLERVKKFEQQMNNKNTLITERYKTQTQQTQHQNHQNQQNFRNKKKPLPVVAPPPWLVRSPAEFWQPPYQFAYPPFGMMYPPRQPFVAGPMMGPAPPAVFPFNPAVPPPPVLRPQPIAYFPKPRHPPWNFGIGVMQPPAHNFGNGNGNGSSYTQ